MPSARWLARLCLAALLLGLFATPGAAQSINRAVIDELNEQLLYVALPLMLFVEVTLVYAVYRFRDNDDPKPTVDDPALEITWTVATGIILLFVGISAFFVLANPFVTPIDAGAAGPAVDGANASEDLEVRVLAYQWGWEFRYPGANVTSRTRLVLPVDTDVRLVMTSSDVIHSLFVPELGLKQDVFPGHDTVVRTHVTRTGEYRLYCAELCGVGHARMDGTVDVRNESAYRTWLDRQSDGSTG